MSSPTRNTTPVALAGATGNLGRRIARHMIRRGGRARALVRSDADRAVVASLRADGVETSIVDFTSAVTLTRACEGTACVVSALAGMREVIVDAQTRLLDAAIEARVPRFIPSDFAIDFLKMPPGCNRNLDWRREFDHRLDAAPVAATSVLCGMFMDLLLGQAPFVLPKRRRVLYWGDADQKMDFTAIDDVAEYTAAAALDSATPRYLRIAGDTVSARDLARVASESTGEKFKLLRPGSVKRLEHIIRVMRFFIPARHSLYPVWQGMQYMHNMFDGRASLEPLDNGRYPGLRWTKVRDVLGPYLGVD